MVMVLPLAWIMWWNEPFWNFVAVGLYIVAAMTDYWDGYFARKFQAQSIEGQLLDPVADKVLVTSLLVMLLSQDKIDPLMVILILSRDLLIGGLRAVAAGEGVIIAAQPSGKWKTALQMFALPLVICEDSLLVFFGIQLSGLGFWLLWIGTALSLYSGFQYLHRFQSARRKKPAS